MKIDRNIEQGATPAAQECTDIPKRRASSGGILEYWPVAAITLGFALTLAWCGLILYGLLRLIFW